ncbi:hypothetical protein P3H15_27165 [Rhodococcus sp. T2V]|uniref:hypothetical protein n=1 Tax=Rhodococcus sp. T2V TaxID=3034164 RepID=UPI0023E263FA|nr:hypothetical protein [Rhodococcus sp. T2V]MDF3308702.1 hypothetical protein [Rhodococcus sp. T2V]
MTGFNFTLPMTLKLRLKDQWDIRTTGRGVAEIEAGEMDVDVLAYKGDQGDPGRDGVPPRFMGDVATTGDLPDPNDLDPDYDLGQWWGITGTNDAWFYNGTPTLERRQNYIGAQGVAGPAITLTKGTITQGTDWNFSLEEVGSNAYKLNIVAKPGPAGADSTVPGPTATIETASDFDDTTEPKTGDVLVKLANGKWGPGTVAMSPGVYKKVGSETSWLAIDTGNNWSGDFQTITTLTIPAQPWAYEPDVYGLVEFSVAAINNVRMDLEARLGAVSGPLLGRGAGDAVGIFESEWTARTLVPAADETAPAGAGSTIVPAGTAATIYLIGRRVDSLAQIRFQTRKERAFLRVRPMPVIA